MIPLRVPSRPRSLSGRLVVTAVALVALVSLLIGTATILAMRVSLSRQLDADVRSSGQRARDLDDDHRPEPGIPDEPGGRGVGNQGPGTLLARMDDVPTGWVLGDRPGDATALPEAALARLSRVPVDGGVHGVTLPGVGSYRVAARPAPDGTVLVSGLPTTDVDRAVATLLGVEVLLVLAGVVAASGAGLVVVRRQLRPLREVATTAHAVAELPLASGAIDLSPRVPAHLTDERTEVGQVGAALNTMLAHVEASLEARHRSEQQVRQFVADASHELRTPLATIAGYAELARRRPDDLTVRTALGKVESESERMTALVEDLLLLARLDAGRPLQRRPVDLTRLLLEAVSDARVLGPDHRWRLDLPDHPLEVDGDEQRLHQVVTNLLTNARKYTPAGTTVTVTARPGRLVVHDDGPGFPAALVDPVDPVDPVDSRQASGAAPTASDGTQQPRPKAFERFARGDAARTRSGQGGSGLGLALVDAIVGAHGGTVSLSSRPGHTAVTVTLPVRAAAG